MGNLTGLLIGPKYQWAIRLLLFALLFALTLGVAGWFTAHQVSDGMRAHTEASLERFIRLRDNVVSTFEALHRDVTATPCTPEFYAQLRRIAFQPDGLSEFIYTPGGVAKCALSVGMLEPELDLGPPDIVNGNPFASDFWFDRSLDFLGLTGLRGTVAAQGSIAMVVPMQVMPEASPRWLSMEVVLVARDGRWWHRSGEVGLYLKHIRDGGAGSLWPLHGDAFHEMACDPVGLHCVVTEATLGNLFAFGRWTVAIVVLVAAVLAAWLAHQLHLLILRYWTFDARFRRNFTAASVHCVYQPVMNLRNGAISGVEVLARWCDVDGRVVYPDEFLPAVEKHGLTFELTRYVVERAKAELGGALPEARRLQVNFNLSPRDLEAGRVIELFDGFGAPGRFDIVIEIVETDTFSVEGAQAAIEQLRRSGIRTYLDDFGTGFSNIHHLAAMTLDGVKLDKAFAMASDDSLTGQLLPSALAMIQQTGRDTVVEGVETEERLAMLRATGQVDYVQGYLIARPLEIGRLVAFLSDRDRVLARPRLVA